ncbi:putative bifunctional diguanylate cyclase/phosphodiesterase [Neobacillus sp. NPDC097160]|uniref:putative bifunctional diguanylate cyclase/phosphodiesterase n=1 Tax=Neobacillus sp. NPDC097160 TaxID=3364298 RepID=UPI003812B0B5
MPEILSGRIFNISFKKWVLVLLFYFFPYFIDFWDLGDQYFHNIFWLLYLIPTLIFVLEKGMVHGGIATGMGSIIILLAESVQPGGIVKHEMIMISELLFVNMFITFAVGVLVQRNNGIIGQLKEKKAELEYLSYHDMLTGLFNMNYLNNYLTKEFHESKASGIPTCMMFFNLDRFKLINDSYGHHIGDQLLKMVAKRLINVVQDMGTVIRAGGDDFILYLPNTNISRAEDFSKLLLDEFSKSFYLEKHEIRIAASIGLANVLKDDSLEDTIQKASSALHFAKENGGGQYQLYCSEFVEIANRRLHLEQGLKKALQEKELELYYQPKLDIMTNQITGMEALLRWNDSVLGPISPVEFIPIAEETGLINPIGEWVLKEACRQTVEWNEIGFNPIHVCVNISSKQFLQDDFVIMIEQILNESDLSPEFLNLEVTESIALFNIHDAIYKLEQLRRIGVTISLDDFGTGYSSLSYVKSLPIDFLKIDRSFINGIFINKQDTAIIDTIISLAHSLGFKVVAEGVEAESQLRGLEEMGCDEIQGYYLAKPMDPVTFKEFLNKKNHGDGSGGLC